VRSQAEVISLPDLILFTVVGARLVMLEFAIMTQTISTDIADARKRGQRERDQPARSK